MFHYTSTYTPGWSVRYFYEIHAPGGVYNTPCNDEDEKPLIADEVDDLVANESDDLTSCNCDGELTKQSPDSLNTNIQDKEGNAALHFAPRIGNEGMLLTLLEPEATDIDLQNKQGESPLHIAVTANRYEAAKCLLEEGCSPDVVDVTGKTALMHARQTGRPRLVSLLLASDADTMIRDAKRLACR